MADYSFFLELALALADIARAELEVPQKTAKSSKPDGSPQTGKDLACERKMRALLHEKVPGHAIWGEEFGRRDGEFQWVLDPIDGSIGYISGCPLYTTLIGLLVAGKPVLGVIEAPALRRRWYGMRGRSCHRAEGNSQAAPCAGSPTAFLEQANVAITLPAASGAVRSLLGSCAHVRYGGDAFNFGCVADGTLDVAVEEGLKPYDWLPFVPVLAAAGAPVTDFAGNPPRADGNGNIVAAGNRALHAACLQALNDAA